MATVCVIYSYKWVVLGRERLATVSVPVQLLLGSGGQREIGYS